MAGKRGRPPGSTNKKGNKVVDNLVAALDFIAPAVKDVVYIGPDHVEAFNGLLSIGMPIQSGIERLCPNYNLLRAAIKRAGETPSLTKLDNERLGVYGGKFRAVVPCMPEDQVTLADQNEKKYPTDDLIKQGFELLNPIVKDGGKTMVEASLLLQADTMVASDRHIMVEFKHGHNFPKVVLPKAFLNAVINCKKKLIMFGYGEVQGTITFWFEDNSWIQTQLFQEDWPNYAGVFSTEFDVFNIRPVPEHMFTAIEALSEFAQDGDVFFGEHSIRSHDNIAVGASYEFGNSPAINVAFNAKRMLMFSKFTHVDFSQNGKALFYLDQPMMRGAIVQRARPATIEDDRPAPVEWTQETVTVQEREPQGALEGMPGTLTPIPNAALPEPSPEPIPNATGETVAVPLRGAYTQEMTEEFSAAQHPEETLPDWVWADDDFEEIDAPAIPHENPAITGDYAPFDLDAHNKRAAENMASADPMAAAYPGVETVTSGGFVIRDAPQ